MLLLSLTDDERFLVSIGLDKKMVVDMTTGMIVAQQSSLKHTSASAGGTSARQQEPRHDRLQLVTGGDSQLTYWALDPMAGQLTASACTWATRCVFYRGRLLRRPRLRVRGLVVVDFSAVHVKHKVLHSTTPVARGRAGDDHDAGAGRRRSGGRRRGDGSISVLEGDRNGAGTCRAFQRGRRRHRLPRRDRHGSTAAALGAGAVGRLKLGGHERGDLYAASVMCADHRAIGAPPAASQLLRQSHNGAVIAVAYPSSSSEFFATASADGTLRVWDVNTYGVLAKAACQPKITGSALCLDFTGEVLLSGWEDGKIRSFDAESGDELWVVDNAHKGGVTAIRASYNRKFVVSGGANGEVRVWEVRTREMVVQLKQHSMAVTSLVLFQDDSHVISASRDRNIYCWELQKESISASLAQRMGGINAFTMLPDHVQLISVGQEKGISFWDLREPNPIAQIGMGSEQLCIDSFTPSNGETVFATAGVDGVVTLWAYKTQSPIGEGRGHSAAVRRCNSRPTAGSRLGGG